MIPVATLTIPTRNRCEILRECILAGLNQSVPVEIIVLDDGSTDQTEEMMRTEFSEVRYERLEGPNGPCVLRNLGARLASTAILFPIDDDAVLKSPRTVEQTMAEFDDARIAAVGIPFINVRVNDKVQSRAPTLAGVWVEHAFTGASYAIRRDVFLAVGGYAEHLFYMGEEGDLALRMLAAGFVTRLGRADPIEHFESPNRVRSRADFLSRRNHVLFALHNVPTPDLPAHLMGTFANGVRAAVSSQFPVRQLAGLGVGLWEGLQGLRSKRRPVTREIYQLHRHLKKDGPALLSEIEDKLPKVPL